MNQRMTPVREKIVEMLSQEHLLSATQLLGLLEKEYPGTNKTTVYRALEFLLGSGAICQHQFDSKEAFFELRDHHHDHLICTHCMKITTTDCSVHVPRTMEGYLIEHHHLTLYGVCADCQKKNNENSFEA